MDKSFNHGYKVSRVVAMVRFIHLLSQILLVDRISLLEEDNVRDSEGSGNLTFFQDTSTRF